jgi:hypothetical protein
VGAALIGGRAQGYSPTLARCLVSVAKRDLVASIREPILSLTVMKSHASSAAGFDILCPSPGVSSGFFFQQSPCEPPWANLRVPSCSLRQTAPEVHNTSDKARPMWHSPILGLPNILCSFVVVAGAVGKILNCRSTGMHACSRGVQTCKLVM